MTVEAEQAAIENLDAVDPANILRVSRILREGGVVGMPTDTLYGIGASVFRSEAVQRVYEIKNRPVGQPMPVLVSGARDLGVLVTEIPLIAWPLIEHFWPGPLTLVLPARPSVPPLVRGGGDTVGVRVPAAKSCLEVLEDLGEPIIGTSANLHGSASAARARDIAVPNLDAILVDDAVVRVGIGSTVVEVRRSECVIHRVGAVPVDELRRALGPRVRVSQAGDR